MDNPLIKSLGEDSTKNQLIENNLVKLQEHFVGLNEYNETPITKDNCEDLFDQWLDDTDLFTLTNIID